MTKQEYTEFLNLQEHYEWLHAAEDRAKTKLEMFTTDDSEFDELVREAVKVYFETEIEKAWKKIEEFKTATAKTGNTRNIIGKAKKVGIKTDGVIFEFKIDDLKEAKKVCTSGPCGHESCPLAAWEHCTLIWHAFDDGNYKEV